MVFYYDLYACKILIINWSQINYIYKYNIQWLYFTFWIINKRSIDISIVGIIIYCVLLVSPPNE